MACLASTIETNACASHIAKLTDVVGLLQITAQASVNWVHAASPSTDVSIAAIETRACTSGIAKVDDTKQLIKLIAQSLCNIQT
jgi:hypothetical protein